MKQHVVKPYIYFLSDESSYTSEYECSLTAEDPKDALAFVGGSVVIAICALIFQVSFQSN